LKRRRTIPPRREVFRSTGISSTLSRGKDEGT
jgi:hypothetical protein